MILNRFGSRWYGAIRVTCAFRGGDDYRLRLGSLVEYYLQNSFLGPATHAGIRATAAVLSSNLNETAGRQQLSRSPLFWEKSSTPGWKLVWQYAASGTSPKARPCIAENRNQR